MVSPEELEQKAKALEASQEQKEFENRQKVIKEQQAAVQDISDTIKNNPITSISEAYFKADLESDNAKVKLHQQAQQNEQDILLAEAQAQETAKVNNDFAQEKLQSSQLFNALNPWTTSKKDYDPGEAFTRNLQDSLNLDAQYNQTRDVEIPLNAKHALEKNLLNYKQGIDTINTNALLAKKNIYDLYERNRELFHGSYELANQYLSRFLQFNNQEFLDYYIKSANFQAKDMYDATQGTIDVTINPLTGLQYIVNRSVVGLLDAGSFFELGLDAITGTLGVTNHSNFFDSLKGVMGLSEVKDAFLQDSKYYDLIDQYVSLSGVINLGISMLPTSLALGAIGKVGGTFGKHLITPQFANKQFYKAQQQLLTNISQRQQLLRTRMNNNALAQTTRDKYAKAYDDLENLSAKVRGLTPDTKISNNDVSTLFGNIDRTNSKILGNALKNDANAMSMIEERGLTEWQRMSKTAKGLGLTGFGLAVLQGIETQRQAQGKTGFGFDDTMLQDIFTGIASAGIDIIGGYATTIAPFSGKGMLSDLLNPLSGPSKTKLGGALRATGDIAVDSVFVEGGGEAIQRYLELQAQNKYTLPDLATLLMSNTGIFGKEQKEIAKAGIQGFIGSVGTATGMTVAGKYLNKSSNDKKSKVIEQGEQVADTVFESSQHSQEYTAQALSPNNKNKNILEQSNNRLKKIADDATALASTQDDLKEMKITRNNEKNKEVVKKAREEALKEQQNIKQLEQMQKEGKQLTEKQQEQLNKKQALESRIDTLDKLAEKLEEFDEAYKRVNEAKIAYDVASATMKTDGLFKVEDADKIDDIIDRLASAKTQEEANDIKNEFINLMSLDNGSKLKKAKAVLLKALNQDPRIYNRTTEIKGAAKKAVNKAKDVASNVATAIKGAASKAVDTAQDLFTDSDATIDTNTQQDNSTQATTTQQQTTQQDNSAQDNTQQTQATTTNEVETVVDATAEETQETQSYESLSSKDFKEVLKALDVDIVFNLLSAELSTNRSPKGKKEGMSKAAEWMQTQFSVLRMGLNDVDMSIHGKSKKREKAGDQNIASKIPRLLNNAITDLVIIKNDRYFFDAESGNFIRFFHTIDDNKQAINRVTRMATTAREMFNSQLPKKVNEIRDEITALTKIDKEANPEEYQKQKEKISALITALKETYGKDLDTLNFDISYMRMFLANVGNSGEIATKLNTLTNNIAAQLVALTKDAQNIKSLFDVLTSKNISEEKKQQYIRALEVNRKRKARGKKGWNTDELIAKYSTPEDKLSTKDENIQNSIKESISTIKKSISPVLDGIKGIVNNVFEKEKDYNEEKVNTAKKDAAKVKLQHAQEVLLETQSFFEDLTDIFTVTHINSVMLYLQRNQYLSSMARPLNVNISLEETQAEVAMNKQLLYMFLKTNETMLYDMFKLDRTEAPLNVINNIIHSILLDRYNNTAPLDSIALILKDIQIPVKNILVSRNVATNKRQDRTQEGMISLYDLLTCNSVAQDVYFTDKDIADAVEMYNKDITPTKIRIVLNDNNKVEPHQQAMIAPYLREILSKRLLNKQLNKQFRNDLSLALLKNQKLLEEINTKLSMGLIVLARDLLSRSNDRNTLLNGKYDPEQEKVVYQYENRKDNYFYAEKYKAQQELPFLRTMLGLENAKDINLDEVYQQIMYLAQSHLNSLSYDVNGNPLLQFKQLFIKDERSKKENPKPTANKSVTYMSINKNFVDDLKALYGESLKEQFKEASDRDSLRHLESNTQYKRRTNNRPATTAIEILESNRNRMEAIEMSNYVQTMFGFMLDNMVNQIANAEAIELDEFNDILEEFTSNTNFRQSLTIENNGLLNRNNPLMYIPVRRMVYDKVSQTWSKKVDYYFLPGILGEENTKTFIEKINGNKDFGSTMMEIIDDFNQTSKAVIAQIQSRYNDFSDLIYIRGNQIYNKGKYEAYTKFDGELDFNHSFHVRYEEIETSGRIFTPTTLANPVNNKLIRDIMTINGKHLDKKYELERNDVNVFKDNSPESKSIRKGLELAFYQIFGQDVDKFALTEEGKKELNALQTDSRYIKDGQITDIEGYNQAVIDILDKHTNYMFGDFNLTQLWNMIANLDINDDISVKKAVYDAFISQLDKYQSKTLDVFKDHPYLSYKNAIAVKNYLQSLMANKADYYKDLYSNNMSVYVDGSATGVFENMIKYKSMPLMAALAKVYTGKSIVFSDNIEEWTEQDLLDESTKHYQGLSQAMKLAVQDKLTEILKSNGILDKYDNVREAIEKKGIDPYTLNLAMFQATIAKYAVAWPDNLYAQIVGTTQVYDRDLVKKLILPLLYGAGESSFFVKAFVLALPNHNRELFKLLQEFQTTYTTNQARGQSDLKSLSNDTMQDIKDKFLEFLKDKSSNNSIAKIYSQYLSNGNQISRFYSGLFKNAISITRNASGNFSLSIDFDQVNTNIGDFSEMLVNPDVAQKYIPDGIFKESAEELQQFVENYNLDVVTTLDSRKINMFKKLDSLINFVDYENNVDYSKELRLFLTETMANVSWLKDELMNPDSKSFIVNANNGKIFFNNSSDNRIAKTLGITFDDSELDERKRQIIIQVRDILRATGMYAPQLSPSVHDLYTPDIAISRQQAAYTRDMNAELEKQMMYSQIEQINRAIKKAFEMTFGKDVVMTEQAVVDNIRNNREFRNRVYNRIQEYLKTYYKDMMSVTQSIAKENVQSCLMTKLKNDNLRKKWIDVFNKQAEIWKEENANKLEIALDKIALSFIEDISLSQMNGKIRFSPHKATLFNVENSLRTLPNVLGLFNHNLESAVMKDIIISNGVSVQIYDGIQSWAGNAVDIINNWNTLFPLLMDSVIDVNSLMLKAFERNKTCSLYPSDVSSVKFLSSAIKGLVQISRTKSVAVNNITSASSVVDSVAVDNQIGNNYDWVAIRLKQALTQLHKIYSKHPQSKLFNIVMQNNTDIFNTRDLNVKTLLDEFDISKPDESVKNILDKYGNVFMDKIQDRFVNSILFSSQSDVVAYDYTFSDLAFLNVYRVSVLGQNKSNNSSDDLVGLHQISDNREIQLNITSVLNNNLELIRDVQDDELSGYDKDIIDSIRAKLNPKFVDTVANAITDYLVRQHFKEKGIDTNTKYKITESKSSVIEVQYEVNGSTKTYLLKQSSIVDKVPSILEATLKFYQQKEGKKDLKTIFNETKKRYSDKEVFFYIKEREDLSIISARNIDGDNVFVSTTFVNNFVNSLLGNKKQQPKVEETPKTEAQRVEENTAWQEDIVAEEATQEEQQLEEREYSEQDEYDGTVRRETMRKVAPEQANAIAEKMLEGLNPTTDIIIHNSYLDENGNIIDDDPVNVAVFNLARERGFKIHSSITDAKKIGILFGKQTKKSRNVVVLYNDPNSYDLFESVEVTNGKDGRFISKGNRELGEFTGDNAVRYNADAITMDSSTEEQIAMHNAIVGSRTEIVAVKGAVSMSDKISVNSNRETPHHIISYDNLSDRVSTNSNVTIFTDSSRANEFKDAKDVVLIDNNTPQKIGSQKVEQKTLEQEIEYAARELAKRNNTNIETEVKKINLLLQKGEIDGVITDMNPNFPQFRGKNKPANAPKFLLYKGDISLLDNTHQTFCFVGDISGIGIKDTVKQREKELISKISRYGKKNGFNPVIVSGLAFGIDQTAHQAAIEFGLPTIAIVSTRPSISGAMTPVTANVVGQDILSNGGLILSEYTEGVNNQNNINGRLIDRCRLQAYFSDAVVMVGVHERNNRGEFKSRHAANNAISYGIPVFAFNFEHLDGNQQYLKNGKAKPIGSVNANYLFESISQPTITPQTSIPSNTKTIDVWWGSSNTQPLSHPSKFLSNMANRPFRYGGREYQSVEHAYQTLKSGNFNENAYKNFKPGKKFHELGTKKTDNWNLRLMQKLITTSLLTNSQAREYIRHNNYFEGYTFTHKNGDTTWSKYFGPILMNSINMIKFADTRLSETKDGKDLLQAINLMPLAKRPKVKFIDSNRQVDKDIAMANDADSGIMLWDGSSDGTKNNIKNMSDKQYAVYNADGSLKEQIVKQLDKNIATDNIVFFISGSRSIDTLPDSNTEFGQRMNTLNDIPNVNFVVGDAVGVDTNVISYFVNKNSDLSNVTIYSSRKGNPQSTPPNTTPKKGNARGNNQYTPEQLEIEGRLLEEGEFKRVLEDRKQQELSNLTDQTEIDAITASYDTAIAVFNNLGNLQVGESTQMSDGRMGEQQTTYSRDENGFVKATNVIQLYGDQMTHTALHETWHGLMDTALNSEFGQRFNEAQNLRHRLVSIMNETINELNNDPEKRLELGLLDDVWEYIINQPTQDLVLHEFYAHFLSQPALAAYLASKTYNQTLNRWSKFIATRKGQNIFKQGANLLKTILGTIFDLLTLATIRNSGNRQALALKTIAKLSAFNTLEGIEQYQKNYNNKLVVRGNKFAIQAFNTVTRNIFKGIEDYIAIKGYSDDDVKGLVSEIRTTLQKVSKDLLPYMEQIHDKDVSLPKKYFLLGLATMKMVVASRHIMANPIQREVAMNVLSDIRQQLFEGTFFDFKFNIDFGLIVNKATKKIVKEVNTIIGVNTAFQQEEEIAGQGSANYVRSILYDKNNTFINEWIAENEVEDPDFKKKYELAIGNYIYVVKPQDYFFNEVSPSIDEAKKIIRYMINDNESNTQQIRKDIAKLHKDIISIIKENNPHLSEEELEVYSNHIRQSIIDLSLTRLNNVSEEYFGTQNVEQVLFQIDRMIHNQHKREVSNKDGQITYKSIGLQYSPNVTSGMDITSDTNYQRIIKNMHKMLTLQMINLIHGEYDVTKANNKGKIGSVARFNEETKIISNKILTAYEEGQKEFKEEIADLLLKTTLFAHQQEKRYFTKRVLNYSVARGYYENGENISDRFFLDNATKGTTLSKRSPNYERNKQSLLAHNYVIASETETHTRFIAKDSLWIEKPIFGRNAPLPYYHEGFIPYQQYNPEVDIVPLHIPEDNLEQQEKMEELLQNYLDKGYEISETYSDIDRGIYILVNNSLVSQYHNPVRRLGFIQSVNKAKGKVIDIQNLETYQSEDYTNRTIDVYYENMYNRIKQRGFLGKPSYKDRANKSPKRIMESKKRLRYETGRDMLENLANIDRSIISIAYNQEKLISRNQHKDFVNTQTWFHILNQQDEIKKRSAGNVNEHHHAVPLFTLVPHPKDAITYSPATNEWIYEDFRIIVNEDIAKQYDLSFSHEDLTTLAYVLKAMNYNYDTAHTDGDFGEQIYVDTRALPMLFGYQDFNPHKIADNDRVRDGKLQKSISTVANILRGLVKESRNNTIIRNPSLAWENFKSNTIGLIAEGVPVKDTFDSIPRVMDQLFEYQQLLLARNAIYTKASTIQVEIYEEGRSHIAREYRQLKEELKRLDKTIANHQLNYVMQNGFYTNIVEDAETVGFRWDEALIDKISKKVGGLSDTAKAAMHEVLVTEKGEAYNSLAMFTRLGDFVPRVIYYNHLVGIEGVSKEEAVELAREKFVNYTTPMWSPSMRAVDKFGITNYLKYKTAIQKQILLAFKNSPIQASSLVALQMFAISTGISQMFSPSTYMVESLLIDGKLPSSFFDNPMTTLNRYKNFLPL